MPGPNPGGPASTEHTLTDAGLRRRVTLEAGDRVGRYRILHTLGSGGMGTVYAATDPDLDRNIAIKVLHDRPGRKVRAESLLHEAQAMAQFSHPNVVTVHDVGTHEGRVFVAMDWVRGPTLRSWMKGRPWDAVLRAFLQAGQGLAAVHAAGLVHRDFKPANVMLHPGGRVVVMDFGLARPTQESSGQISASPLPNVNNTHDDDISRAGSVQGTPAYMAPEQHLAFDVDARADQFSYCVSVFEGMFGKRPFRARTVTELVMRISAGEFAEVERNGVPPRIRRALTRGLAELPKDRWLTMENLLDRLQPTGRGTWMIWGAGAAALSTVAFAAVPPADPCETRGDAVRDLWSKGRRDSLLTALEASPKPFAEETAGRVDETIAAYVDRLARAHDQACQVSIEPALLDRRTACLRQRSGVLRATIDALTATAGDGLQRAVQVLSHLPEVDTCLDPESLARATALPADETRRIEIERARDAISEALAMKEAGDIEGAHVRAKAALVLARDTGFSPVEVEALNAWSSAQEARGDYGAAAETSEAAFHLAHSSHHDVEALRAAVQLVYVVGYRLQQHEVAKGWLRHAEALVARIDNGGLEARLINNEATLAYSSGDYDAAARGFERTAELRESLQGPEHPDVAAAHSNLGLALTRLDRLEEALKHHARARKSWEASLGPSHPMVAISVHNRALVFERLKRLDEAGAEYERAIELRIRSQGAAHPSVALSMNNLGHVRMDQGRPLDALELHQKALALWHQAYGPEHRRVAEALGGIAEALHKQSRFEEAHRFADRSLSTLATVVGTAHPDYALGLVTLADIQSAEGDIEGSVEHYRQARSALVDARGAAAETVETIDARLKALGQDALETGEQ